MTSSQPIVTQNAINFTPDNKRCYAYSGTGTAGTTADFVGLNFETNSEYLVVRIYVLYDADDLASGSQFGYFFEMNGVQVAFTRREASAADIVDSPLPSYLDLIIPPFTAFTATAFSNASGMDVGFQLTGKVYGMTETGYQ